MRPLSLAVESTTIPFLADGSGFMALHEGYTRDGDLDALTASYSGPQASVQVEATPGGARVVLGESLEVRLSKRQVDQLIAELIAEGLLS